MAVLISDVFVHYNHDDDNVVVDAKVVEKITDHELGQMLNYLKITDKKVGVILNFRNSRLEWKRVIRTEGA